MAISLSGDLSYLCASARYDVGHVLKWSSFRQVRMEFARAYALIARSTPIGEAVGGGGDLSHLLETICTEARMTE